MYPLRNGRVAIIAQLEIEGADEKYVDFLTGLDIHILCLLTNLTF